jgi:hypothetical protein
VARTDFSLSIKISSTKEAGTFLPAGLRKHKKNSFQHADME